MIVKTQINYNPYTPIGTVKGFLIKDEFKKEVAFLIIVITFFIMLLFVGLAYSDSLEDTPKGKQFVKEFKTDVIQRTLSLWNGRFTIRLGNNERVYKNCTKVYCDEQTIRFMCTDRRVIASAPYIIEEES